MRLERIVGAQDGHVAPIAVLVSALVCVGGEREREALQGLYEDFLVFCMIAVFIASIRNEKQRKMRVSRAGGRVTRVIALGEGVVGGLDLLHGDLRIGGQAENLVELGELVKVPVVGFYKGVRGAGRTRKGSGE